MIILDTNFLLIPSLFHIDIFSEIERICHFRYTLFITEPTIHELESIVGSGRGKFSDAARIGLQLIRAKAVRVISDKTKNIKNTDRFILETVKQGDIVATLDRKLRFQLKKMNIRSINMRKKSYLVVG